MKESPMCPACLAAALPLIAGTATGSAALAFAARKLRSTHQKRERTMETIENTSARVVSRQDWLEARTALLAKEKALTREHDELARLRRELPWTKVEKTYTFDAPEGKRALGDLFGGRSQLLV